MHCEEKDLTQSLLNVIVKVRKVRFGLFLHIYLCTSVVLKLWKHTTTQFSLFGNSALSLVVMDPTWSRCLLDPLVDDADVTIWCMSCLSRRLIDSGHEEL